MKGYIRERFGVNGHVGEVLGGGGEGRYIRGGIYQSEAGGSPTRGRGGKRRRRRRRRRKRRRKRRRGSKGQGTRQREGVPVFLKGRSVGE